MKLVLKTTIILDTWHKINYYETLKQYTLSGTNTHLEKNPILSCTFQRFVRETDKSVYAESKKSRDKIMNDARNFKNS
jgi:hypothetical protein